MKLFTDIEKTIERGFRKWTERVLGPAEANELVVVHRAILREVEGRVETLAGGRRVFPYRRLIVTLISADTDRRQRWAGGADRRRASAERHSRGARACALRDAAGDCGGGAILGDRDSAVRHRVPGGGAGGHRSRRAGRSGGAGGRGAPVADLGSRVFEYRQILPATICPASPLRLRFFSRVPPAMSMVVRFYALVP